MRVVIIELFFSFITLQSLLVFILGSVFVFQRFCLEKCEFYKGFCRQMQLCLHFILHKYVKTCLFLFQVLFNTFGLVLISESRMNTEWIKVAYIQGKKDKQDPFFTVSVVKWTTYFLFYKIILI